VTYARLDRCNGPPCPHCGCEDVEIAPLPTPPRRCPGQSGPVESWYRQAQVRYRRAQCRACYAEFYVEDIEQSEPVIETPQLPPIEYQGVMLSPAPLDYKLVKVPICPVCRSENVRITSTREFLRHYKCECGETFKRAKE